MSQNLNETRLSSVYLTFQETVKDNVDNCKIYITKDNKVNKEENVNAKEEKEEKEDEKTDNEYNSDIYVKLTTEEQHNIYLRGLNGAIENYKKTNPKEYENSCIIGDDIMNKKYDLTSGVDIKGDIIQCKNILMTVLQYGLDYSDLYESEIKLLERLLKDTMNIVNDVKDIFNNVEDIERILNDLVSRMIDVENDY